MKLQKLMILGLLVIGGVRGADEKITTPITETPTKISFFKEGKRPEVIQINEENIQKIIDFLQEDLGEVEKKEVQNITGETPSFDVVKKYNFFELPDDIKLLLPDGIEGICITKSSRDGKTIQGYTVRINNNNNSYGFRKGVHTPTPSLLLTEGNNKETPTSTKETKETPTSETEVKETTPSLSSSSKSTEETKETPTEEKEARKIKIKSYVRKDAQALNLEEKTQIQNFLWLINDLSEEDLYILRLCNNTVHGFIILDNLRLSEEHLKTLNRIERINFSDGTYLRVKLKKDLEQSVFKKNVALGVGGFIAASVIGYSVYKGYVTQESIMGAMSRFYNYLPTEKMMLDKTDAICTSMDSLGRLMTQEQIIFVLKAIMPTFPFLAICCLDINEEKIKNSSSEKAQKMLYRIRVLGGLSLIGVGLTVGSLYSGKTPGNLLQDGIYNLKHEVEWTLNNMSNIGKNNILYGNRAMCSKLSGLPSA